MFKYIYLMAHIIMCIWSMTETKVKLDKSTFTSTFNLVGKNLQISHQPLKTKMNVKNVKKKLNKTNKIKY